MPDGSFKTVCLGDYLGKWVVLVTYPLDWTYVCPSELTAFSDRAKEFHDLGAEVLVMSTDSKESHLAWTLTPRTHGGVAKMAVPMLRYGVDLLA